MKNKVVAGIDIGGTKIAIALENPQKERIAFRNIPTEVEIGPERILENVRDCVEAMLAETETSLEIIGLCTPGPVDIEKGLVLSPANLPDWKEFPIVKILEDKFKVPVIFDNDANAAALAECFYGAGRGFETVLYVTVSTGVGGAIVFGGEIYHGLAASAGEIGHTIVKADGIVCGCGTRGCLETIASGTYIARRAKEKAGEKGEYYYGQPIDEITAKTVIEAVRAGDELAISVWDETVRYLAIGIGNAITTIAPEAVVIGGGISLAGDILFKPLYDHLKQNVSMLPIERVKILPATLGGESGIYGALILAGKTVSSEQ
jgi:glucokinase